MPPDVLHERVLATADDAIMAANCVVVVGATVVVGGAMVTRAVRVAVAALAGTASTGGGVVRWVLGRGQTGRFSSPEVGSATDAGTFVGGAAVVSIQVDAASIVAMLAVL